MLAYTYDTEGYLTGTVNAIPDPLGTAIKGSPQFLAPKGATLLEPPATVDGEKARFVGGAGLGGIAGFDAADGLA